MRGQLWGSGPDEAGDRRAASRRRRADGSAPRRQRDRSASRPRPGLAIALALAAVSMLGGCAHFVILHDPLTATEHNDLGVAYESSAKLDLAAKEYRRSLRLDPHQSRTWVNLGNVEAARGRWRGAEKSYRRALRDSATNTDAMNNLAVALIRQGGRRDEARALAERAVGLAGGRDSVYRATLDEVNASRR